MPHTSSQAFLRELDKKLWTAADKLRSNLDAAVYKHAVLGLIFLKYVSDSFAQRQAEIEEQIRDPESDFHLSPADYGSFAKYDEAIAAELEERDYYIEKNVFWVPALARWKTLQDSAKLPAGTDITVKNGKTTTYKITSTGKLIDDALEAVEKENVNGAERHRLPARGARRVRAGARIKLKNVLNKNYTQLQIDPANLAGLIDLIATIPFQHATCPGIVKRRRTPKSIVSLIVEMIEPYQVRVYDPAMGSGGFFVGDTRPSGVRFAKRCRASARGVVQSERFIEEHDGTIGDIMVFGQDQWAWGAHLRRAQRARRVRLRRKQPNQCNPTTWRLAAMNMAKSLPRQSETATGGIDFDVGKEPADTFTRDQHPDLSLSRHSAATPDADFVMALPSAAARSLPRSHPADRPNGRINPPFNIKEWWDGKLEGDARWKYGTPPQGNANFAWVQHMLHHLAPNGSMALLVPKYPASSDLPDRMAVWEN